MAGVRWKRPGGPAEGSSPRVHELASARVRDFGRPGQDKGTRFLGSGAWQGYGVRGPRAWQRYAGLELVRLRERLQEPQAST